MLLPDSSGFFERDEEIQNFEVLPTKTYRIDTENKRIMGTIEDADSVMQFVKKVLSTDKYAYEIYDWYYGNELIKLTGREYDYIVAELPRIVREALLVDDRITGVEHFKFRQTSLNSMIVSFTVNSIYSNIDYDMEVQI